MIGTTVPWMARRTALEQQQVSSTDVLRKRLPIGVSKEEVYEHLEKVLKSQTFSHADRLTGFLRYIVSVLLEETIGRIKEYHIAIDVFGKPQSFDPRLDPIVRVEAARLRSRLKLYFETEGQADRLLIQIPKGGYIPVIIPASPNLETGLRTNRLHHRMGATSDIGVALMPLLNLDSGPEAELLCDSLTEELIDMLTDVAGIRVAPRISISQFKYRPQEARRIGKRLGVDFILEGSVRQWKDQLLVKVRIIDAYTGFGSRLGSFERAVQDPVTMQMEICEAIISMLKLRFLNEDLDALRGTEESALKSA